MKIKGEKGLRKTHQRLEEMNYGMKELEYIGYRISHEQAR